MRKDYPYRAPDFDEWLRERRDPGGVTLREAFDAGEQYGADNERGFLFGALSDYAFEASVKGGLELADYIRYRLLRQQHEELAASPPKWRRCFTATVRQRRT